MSIKYKSISRDELQKKADEQDKKIQDEMNTFFNAQDTCMIDIFSEYRIANMKLKSTLLVLKDCEPDNIYLTAYINHKAVEDGLLDRVEKLTVTTSNKPAGSP